MAACSSPALAEAGLIQVEQQQITILDSDGLAVKALLASQTFSFLPNPTKVKYKRRRFCYSDGAVRHCYQAQKELPVSPHVSMPPPAYADARQQVQYVSEEPQTRLAFVAARFG
jgi:hypothetical protein